mmetsp:Transcript_352/g.672  ORF Transcript_352/g.672 Transcript_352/m.672 type:complete len:310 (-) Transcript_352:144-1073(-)
MKDFQSEQSTLEDVQEIVARMCRQEATTYRRSDYLTMDPTLEVEVADGTWRQRIIEWMYGVVDHCSLRRDSVGVAAIFLDLCVERNLVESRQEFQLAAMTALQLAIKLYDSTMVKLDSMVKLGRGQFQIQDVVEMESKLLAALQWRGHPPTSLCFLRQYLQLVPSSVSSMTKYMLSEVTRFIAEISVCLYKFVKYPPSAVAYATLVTAMERIGDSVLAPWQRQEILTRAANTLDESVIHSPMMMEIYHLLQASLQKNVNLEHLLKTIEVQCGGVDTFVHSKKQVVMRGNSYYEPCDPPGHQHSPRDVVQ